MWLVEKVVTVSLESGLQARPAAQFVQEAVKFSSNIFIEKNQKQVNAKSIMGLMSLAIAQYETIELIAEGTDEEEALEHLGNIIEQIH